MTPAITQLKSLDAEATYLTARIRDLRGITPEFEAALRRAKDALEAHVMMIESNEAALACLRQQAVFIASHIGAAEYPNWQEQVGQVEAAALFEPEPQGDQVEAVSDDEIDTANEALVEASDAEPTEVVSPADDGDLIDPATYWTPSAAVPETNFETVGEVAEKIISALDDLADEPPSTADASDEPEMTHEEVEEYEASVREADRVFAQ